MRKGLSNQRGCETGDFYDPYSTVEKQAFGVDSTALNG